jgi:hypothetical protein
VTHLDKRAKGDQKMDIYISWINLFATGLVD